MNTFTVYKLGEGYKTGSDGKLMTLWPYEVYFAPSRKDAPWCFCEGDTRNGSGACFNARQLLEGSAIWREHMTLTQTIWIVPFLERMARGETVGAQEVLEAYRVAHGTMPPSEEWPAW